MPDPISRDPNPPLWRAQHFDAGLYLVSTPIGNLRDITLRALDVLAAADHIYAEDTRVSQKLLTAYGLKGSLKPYHDHNAAAQAPKIVKQVKDGEVVAMISDAGTPLVSDPGYRAATAVLEAGLKVIPVPGASSILAALQLSGLPSDQFTFAGFVPAKDGARRQFLEELSHFPGSVMVFESARRVEATLAAIAEVLGNRRVALVREITKKFEESWRMSAEDMLERLRKDGPPKGEIVLVIAPASGDGTWSEAQVRAALSEAAGEKLKSAAARIAEMSGWAKRDVYQLGLDVKDNA